ncbi:hypothetical protein ACSNOI_43935, partial [Actinomadura kijaniata]|uniref:hypothetical protein n=1 Tax=Actinomadura kijaniata TaxID=46161 RepID=UPI003F1A63DE
PAEAVHRAAVLAEATHWVAAVAHTLLLGDYQARYPAGPRAAVQRRIPAVAADQRALIERLASRREEREYVWPMLLRDLQAVRAAASQARQDEGAAELAVALEHAIDRLLAQHRMAVRPRLEMNGWLPVRHPDHTTATSAGDVGDGAPTAGDYLATVAWWGPDPTTASTPHCWPGCSTTTNSTAPGTATIRSAA